MALSLKHPLFLASLVVLFFLLFTFLRFAMHRNRPDEVRERSVFGSFHSKFLLEGAEKVSNSEGSETPTVVAMVDPLSTLHTGIHKLIRLPELSVRCLVSSFNFSALLRAPESERNTAAATYSLSEEVLCPGGSLFSLSRFRMLEGLVDRPSQTVVCLVFGQEEATWSKLKFFFITEI